MIRNLYNNKGVWDPENDSRFPLPWKFKRQVAESRLVPYNQLAQTLDYQPYNQKTKELHAKAKYWQNVEELWKGPVSNLARNIKNSYLGMHEQIITDPISSEEMSQKLMVAMTKPSPLKLLEPYAVGFSYVEDQISRELTNKNPVLKAVFQGIQRTTSEYGINGVKFWVGEQK